MLVKKIEQAVVGKKANNGSQLTVRRMVEDGKDYRLVIGWH
jgi:hypothetical protein